MDAISRRQARPAAAPAPRRVGIPSPTPAATGAAVRASQASPERVRRTAEDGPVGDQVVRRGVGDLDGRPCRPGADARRRRPARSAPAGCRARGRTAGGSRRPCGPRPRRPAARRVRPTSRLFSSQAISSDERRPAARSAPARPPAAPGRAASAAGVPGRLEYWKVKAPANRAAPTTSRVACEVLLGLAGEADDDVGGDRGVGHRGADPVDDAEVRSLPVGPAHRLAAPGPSRTAAACAAAASRSASRPSPR